MDSRQIPKARNLGFEAIFRRMTTAAAIDRLVHHSVILELNVDSYRTQAAKSRIDQQRAEKTPDDSDTNKIDHE